MSLPRVKWEGSRHENAAGGPSIVDELGSKQGEWENSCSKANTAILSV